MSGESEMKRTRFAVAAVVRGPAEGEFLAVRRPDSDESLPGVWGLPAISLAPGELPEAGLRRLGREKLGVELQPASMVGIRWADRGEYELILMDIEARLESGEPSVERATTSATRFVEQRWVSDPSLLREAARAGSLCSQILLEARGIAF
jgi:ADP-ribose pyrophosphatase YjhB (NUDIX family)